MKTSRRRSRQGFTLIELMISLAVFLIIAGAAFSLFAKHAPLYARQQGVAGLNVTLRNVVTLMELDVANAGTGYYVGANVPAWPVGLTVNNNPPSSTCFNSVAKTYSSSCFDSITIISVDPNTPPAHPDPGGSSYVSTDTSSELKVGVPSAPAWTGTTAAFAALFHSGDYILVVNQDASQMAVAQLSQDGQVVGGKVDLQHNPTCGLKDTGSTSGCGDGLGITNYASYEGAADQYKNKLGYQFDSNA